MNIVLFDGICNLCNNTVLFLIKYDKDNNLHFASQQTDTGKKLIAQYLVNANTQSVILIKNEAIYYKSDAIIEIAKLLKGWPRLIIIASVFPAFFRNWMYDLVANNRYKIFGKKSFCMIPSKEIEHKFII